MEATMGLLNKLASLFSSAPYVPADQKQRELLKAATVMKKQKAYSLAVLRIREALEITRKHELGITCQELGRIGDYLMLAGQPRDAFDEFMKVAQCYYTPHWASNIREKVSTLSFGLQKAGGVFLEVGDTVRGRAMNLAGLVLWGMCFREEGETKRDFNTRAKDELNTAIEEIEHTLEDDADSSTLTRVVGFTKAWIKSDSPCDYQELCDKMYCLLGGSGKCIDPSALQNQRTDRG
jgi:hypothetical protein